MWVSSSYTILLREGKEEVKGMVYMPAMIGIHTDDDGKISVTHIASGKRIGGMIAPEKFERCVGFVEDISNITNWKEKEPELKSIYEEYKRIREHWLGFYVEG